MIIDVPRRWRTRLRPGKEVMVRGASEHNLRSVDGAFPLGCLIAVTGASGSDKLTLVNEILYNAPAKELDGTRIAPGQRTGTAATDVPDKVVHVDQGPLSGTSRSNLAIYTGAFDHIRRLFSETTEAKVRGYQPGRFSFNVKGGRCEACSGDGTIKIEMWYLPDVYVTCEVCEGARYNPDTLAVHYKGKTIADVLDMPIEEATGFFEPVPAIHRPLKTLVDVGLGYVRLGQPAATLSGGEAQRIKLASELQRRSTGRIYMLDEPTAGLHSEDIRKLLGVLGPGRGRQHCLRDRSQPGRDQDRGLDDRPRARRWVMQRHRGRDRHPRAGRARSRTPRRRRSRPTHVRPSPSRVLPAPCPAGTVAGPGVCAPASAKAGHRHAIYLRCGAGIARTRRLRVAGSRRQRHSAQPALARIAARRDYRPFPGRLVPPPAGRRPAAAIPENTLRRSGVGRPDATSGKRR